MESEFELGMEISEIAAIHDRTNGAICARLKKHGLIENLQESKEKGIPSF